MKYSYVMAALAAPVVIAAPAKRQSDNIDTTVLQFALTLEHLENVFYKQALQKFSQDDFKKAGYGPNYYNNLRYIASDEESHVKFLQGALVAAKQTPTAACTYKFPYTDVQSFITLSSILEGVGTSAYLGGAPLITSKDYLTAAGSILVTEALHTSLQRNAINEIPNANPYGTPLDPTSVYTLAAAFIDQCPPSNPTLPFTPYPGLTLKTAAGSCEQVDCKPKVFYKRDETSAASWGQWSNTGKDNKDQKDKKDHDHYDGKDGAWDDEHRDHKTDEWHGKDFDFYGKNKNDGQYNKDYDNNGCDYFGYDKDGKYNSGYDNKGYDHFGYDKDGKYNEKYDKKGYNGEKYDGEKYNGEKYNSEEYNGEEYHDEKYNGQKYDDEKEVKDGQYKDNKQEVKDTKKGQDDSWNNWEAPTSSKNQPSLKIGDKVTFSLAKKGKCPDGSYLTFVSGLSVVSVPASIEGDDATAKIPTVAMGQCYVFLTKTAAQNNKLDGASVIAGPAILEVKPAPPSIDFNQAR